MAVLFEDDTLFLQRILRASGFYKKKLDGDWGSGTEQAVKDFDAATAEIAARLGTFDTRTERLIHTLIPKAQEAARIFLKRVRDTGIDARIISGTRTYAEQNALYKIGRGGDKRAKVTNAKGGQSNHNFGIAWDIGIFKSSKYLGESPLYAKAAEVGAADGLEWGGSWKTFKDTPHYQLKTGLGASDVRERFENGLPFV